jgi:hypothetical protein
MDSRRSQHKSLLSKVVLRAAVNRCGCCGAQGTVKRLQQNCERERDSHVSAHAIQVWPHLHPLLLVRGACYRGCWCKPTPSPPGLSRGDPASLKICRGPCYR